MTLEEQINQSHAMVTFYKLELNTYYGIQMQSTNDLIDLYIKEKQKLKRLELKKLRIKKIKQLL